MDVLDNVGGVVMVVVVRDDGGINVLLFRGHSDSLRRRNGTSIYRG